MQWFMRMTCAVLVTTSLASGCGPDGSTGPESYPAPVPPPAPPPPPPAPTVGYVWGHVVEASGVCIPGAVVEIIVGPSTGSKRTQEEPCDAWSYAIGWEYNLPYGARVKFRATVAGYRPAEREHVVANGGYPVTIELVKN